MDFKKKTNLEDGLQLDGVDPANGEVIVGDGLGGVAWGSPPAQGVSADAGNDLAAGTDGLPYFAESAAPFDPNAGRRLVDQGWDTGSGTQTITTAAANVTGISITKTLQSGDIVVVTASLVFRISNATGSTGNSITGSIWTDQQTLSGGFQKRDMRHGGTGNIAVHRLFNASSNASYNFRLRVDKDSSGGTANVEGLNSNMSVQIFRRV